MVRIIGVFLGGALGIVAVAIGMGWLFLRDMCGNEVIDVATSPDGQWDAILFERNCGATTGFSSQISLLKAGGSLGNRSGNIYVSDGYPQGYELRWGMNDSLEVSGAHGRRYKAETQFSGIEVIYK